jgi:hypothetical protein
MAYNINISPGAPPLLWSNIYEAFEKINENFDSIIASTGLGITPVNFSELFTDVSPEDSQKYSLGSINKKWKSVFTGEFSSVSGSELNGVWLGSAHIKGIGVTVNLPENSTVGGDPESGVGVSLIIDPEKTFFKTIRVDSINDIVAPNFSSVLNIVSGSSIGLSANNITQTLTIDNLGVTDIIASTGIGLDSLTGSVTITNTGVTSIGPTTTLPVGLTSGSGVSVNVSNGDVTITNTGVISASAGPGISITTDTSSGSILISNTLPAQPTFLNFVINNDLLDPISADSLSDSFFLNSGYGLIFTKNTTEDSLIIEWNNRSDLIGSVFADDSTLLVDAVGGKLVGEVETLIGSITNLTSANFIVENISAFNNFGVNIGAGGNNNLVVLETEVRIQNFPLVASAGIQGSLTGTVTGDVKGSVFADDSSLLVDSVSGIIVGPVETSRLRTSEASIRLGIEYDFEDPVGGPATQTVAIGAFAGEIRQNTNAIAIGYIAANEDQGDHAIAVGVNSGGQRQASFAAAFGVEAGYRDQGTRALALGYQAGAFSQGLESVAIGKGAGHTNQPANSIVINASGANLNGDGAGLFIAPIRSSTGTGNILQYNTLTKEIIYSSSITVDLIGSVFGDDSTKIVDSVENRVYARSIESNDYIKTGVFDNAAARDSAIPNPIAGQIVFVSDTSQFFGYTGVAWTALN